VAIIWGFVPKLRIFDAHFGLTKSGNYLGVLAKTAHF
jgi:hypothetical protein